MTAAHWCCMSMSAGVVIAVVYQEKFVWNKTVKQSGTHLSLMF